jgi:hypothetical protein
MYCNFWGVNYPALVSRSLLIYPYLISNPIHLCQRVQVRTVAFSARTVLHSALLSVHSAWLGMHSPRSHVCMVG